LDLEIPSGQRVLLAGPSGAGKSTQLRALAGVLLTADIGELTGEVRVGDAPVGSRPGQAGLLLQDPADAKVAARVGRDVAFGPENVALSRPDIWLRVAESLAAVRFPYDTGHLTAQLSGGEGQRLALAGALALRPGLVLLDEPTAMLDQASADDVRRAVLDAVRSVGATLVVVEHHLEPWIADIDRLIVLSSRGEVVADGSPRELFRRHGDSLAAQGVWVPGLPAPTPMRLADGLAGPWPVGRPRPTGSGATRDGADQGDEPLLAAARAAIASRLRPVDLTVRAGRITAVTGRSGSGKTTLLAGLAGLLRVSSGRIMATPVLAGRLGPDPRRWRSPDLARRIGWVAQHPEQAFVARTVRAELLAGLRGDSGTADGSARPSRAAEARADGLLTALGLAQVAGVDPHRLSGGEQRRLAVAAALTQGPRVLLLDEPTLGQDRLTWSAVSGALAAARAAGTGLVVATHDRALIDQLADAVHDLSAPAGPAALPGAGTRPAGAPSRPVVARCGPLAMLLVSLLAVLGSVFVRDWRVGLVALGVELALAPLAVADLRRSAVRLVPGLLAALSIGWSSWLLGGHRLTTGFTAGLRILVLVVPGALLTAHLDPSRLGDDLAQRLHLPARPVVATVAALQRVEDLSSVWAQASWSRRVRGLGAGRSPVARVREAAALTFALLVQSIRQAAQMAVAMDARGFAGARRRTWAEPSRWLASDTVLVLVGLAMSAVPAVLDVTWM
jgi:energy-coupling factor transporter ATP-binding protein EcfA2/energy-coupling factor transporter transmembrane protein EcfT